MLVIIGNFVMLNLFLAILLRNFDEAKTQIEIKLKINQEMEQKKKLQN